MTAITLSDITTEACRWISLNPSYVLWPVLIGIIILVLAIVLALRYKNSKEKVSSDYQKACNDLKSYSTQLAALKSEQEQQGAKIHQYEMDVEQWRREFESKKSESATLLSEKKTLSQQVDELKAIIEEKTVRLSELEETMMATTRQIEASNQLLEAERNEHQRVLQENRAKTTYAEELKSEVNTLRVTLEAKETEKSSLMEQLDTKVSELTQLRTLLATKDSIIDEKDKIIKGLETRVQETLKTLEQIQETPKLAVDNHCFKDRPSESDGHVPSYNELNKHSRDSLLQFDSENHIYTVNGCEFKSVTNIVEECFEQFDADYWAKKKASSLGMTPQQVKDMWERRGEESRNLGSQMHEKIERFYLGLPNTPDETYNLFCQFTKSHHLKPYRTEWGIYDEDSKVAGTLDFLNYDDGVFTIYDWKRSNKIIVNGQPEKNSRWGKKAFSPIDHVHDTTYWHYALQVSIYHYILEKNYGINVSAGRLAVFHPDYNRPYVVDVPYMRDEVMAVLRKNR